MKEIINNNQHFKVTSERGDFYICEDTKGKVKMFAKKDVEVVEVEAMPKAKTYKKQAPLTAEQQLKVDKRHAAFRNDLKNASLQENFLDCQIKSGNYNTDLIR